MKSESPTLEQALSLARQLTPIEKVQLIEKIIPDVAASLEAATVDSSTVRQPLRSVHGLCADLGKAPTAEMIDENRREFLDNFPRISRDSKIQAADLNTIW